MIRSDVDAITKLEQKLGRTEKALEVAMDYINFILMEDGYEYSAGVAKKQIKEILELELRN